LLPPPEGTAYDYVLASGIFTKRQEDPESYLRDAVTRMFALSTQGAAFNVLSVRSPAEPGEFHADPLAILTFCRTLTPWVRLRDDYHPRDFTVYLYRAAQP
jgi:hypothetical protein